MALFEGKTPAERNKTIAAVVLPLLALIFVVRMLFSSGPSAPTRGATNSNSNGRRTAQRTQPTNARNANAQADRVAAEDDPMTYTPIVCCSPPYGDAGVGRNIFGFYEKPVKPATPVETVIPPPTPTPTPPILLASLAPQSVFAKTGNFTLQLSGDKFGPANRVYMEGQELPTQYRSIQQLTATVPASLITSQGPRRVEVHTPDGKLFSNPQTLNVMQAPAPTYTYVGFLKRARANTAVLKDSRGELYSVREGDIVEGRFRVAEISERGVEVVDKDLNIKHTMPYIASGNSGPGRGPAPGSIQPPPPPPADEDGDAEPQ
ncbi:MAG TPA: hypothetical protein VM936_10040 [Pyrinomonadaceae bacterium]|jgi:hypothetical protein|nr:hypothetical protein [Pyrinomonadaceae bacterium]